MSFAHPKRPTRQRRELPPPVGGVAAGNPRPKAIDGVGGNPNKRAGEAKAKANSRRPAVESAKVRAVGGARRKILVGGGAQQKRRNDGDAEEDEKAKYLAELSTLAIASELAQDARDGKLPPSALSLRPQFLKNNTSFPSHHTHLSVRPSVNISSSSGGGGEGAR